MVQFDGLRIAGIRSIGDTPQCINFLTPLTIIQGLNGTGKTTIIEALNYVTTGALPAGKMQTFIHNAQIANTSRVDALVQLEFRDIKGNKCTATKRMNASTSHTGKLSTKSDEFTLKIVDKFGNLKSVSSKICDFNKEGVQIQLIDKELPHLENNTRARADLRLRYDETLTALKHNRKSIEQKLKEERETVDKELVIIRKQLEMAVKCNHEFDVIQGQINAQKRFLDGMPPLTYKDSREQLQQSIDELKHSASVREADEHRASVVRQVQSIAFEMNQCKKLEEAYRTKQMQHESRLMMIENRESEYSTLLEQYARKYDIIAGPNFVEQLREKVQNIEEKRACFVADTDGQQRQLAENIEKLRLNMAQLNSSCTTKRQECAKLSQAIASAERELRSLGPTTQIVDKLTQDIVKWESQLKQLSDFSLLDDVWQSLQGLQTDLNTLRMDMMELASSGGDEGVVGKATALLEKAGDKLDLSMEHIGTLKRRVQLSNQLAEFKDRRAAASEKAIQVETIRESIGEKSEQIKQLEQLIATASRELPEVERQLRAMERSKQELDASVHQQLRRMSLEVDGINGALEKIAELGESNERDRLSISATPTDFREMLEEQKLRLENLACRKSQLEKQLDGDEGKKHQLRTLEDQLRRMEMEEQLEKYKKQLEDAKENAMVKGAENLMELRKKEQTVGQRAVEVNNRIQQKTGEQLQLKRKVEELRAQLEETRYANAQKLYVDKLVERNVTSASIGDLERYYKVVDNAIINFHQQKMEQINQILSRTVTTKRQECAKLSQAIASAERELRSLGPTTQIVDKLTQDIVKWESQLKQLSDFSLLDDVWQNLQGLQTDLNTLRMDMMELASSGGDEGVVGKATALLEKAGDKLDLSMEHIGTLKRRVQLSNQLAEFKDRRAAASEKAIQVETIRESIGEKSEQIKQLEQLIATASRELPEELDASVHQQLRRMSLEVDGINGALEKIAELGESNERDRLSMSATPTDFREMLEEQKLRLENLACRKSQLEKQLDGDEGKKHQLRTLEDQLRRMEMEDQLEKYKRQLEDAKENATVKGTDNLMELRKKEQTVGQRAVEVNNRIQQKTGEQLQLKRKVEELRAQLEETRYANAQKLYVDKLVERNVTSASIGDLERYYKVVDNAIINFHQQKMEQINQILHELWIRVYQGNDIDTIKIKSQPVSGVEKKKSYDYSVVMTVDQVDIDMRDRCSAGQKVLASILIRIALADVFAGNCRILALDEPTTNLDEDKVENIGSMLKSLIQIRKPTTTGGAIGAQRIYEADDLDFEDDDGDELAGAATERTRAAEEDTNDGDDGMEVNRSLQLIVITHDRRLVEHLHLACRPEYIYSLAKDENGVSHIKEHSQITTNADLDLS
uniref:AAA_23 domain-containing protein n=1 Tax=Globodera pallida TaxID=36090 RepID=A0A183BMU1_GLOPA